MIRPYRPPDLAALTEVWYRASLIAHPFLDAAFLSQERINIAAVYLPVAETYVYTQAGAVVGFITLIGNEVGALFVDPPAQGQGVGRALMDHARERRDELVLDVFEANPLGRRFYARYGFEEVKTHLHEATGYRLVRLRLGPAPPNTRPGTA